MRVRNISLTVIKIIVLIIGLIFLLGLSVWADTSVEQTEVDYSDISEIGNFDAINSGDSVSSEEAVESTARRIIVLASQLEDNYGAVVEYLMPYGEIVLEYSSEKKADYAYEELSQKYECYKDEYIDVSIGSEDASSESGNPEGKITTCSSDNQSHDATQTTSDNQSEQTLANAIEQNLGMTNLKNDKLERDVTVAILDTGLSDASEVFDGRVVAQGYDFINNTAEMTDSNGHGTHVAGIIAMNTPSNVKILPIRIIADSGSTGSSLLMISAALRYAISNGADIINMSLDFSSASQSSLKYLDSIIEEAYDNGVICCVAAGNDGIELEKDNYPACIGAAITVSAAENDGTLCNFSNYGIEVDFSAPGRDIASVSTTGKVAVMSGTSQAAPFISACFSYVIGSGKYDSSKQYINALKETCLDLGIDGRDVQFGWGLPYLTDTQPTQHRYKKTIVKKATCTEDGIARYSCTDDGCNVEYTKIIPAIGHEWILSADDSSVENNSNDAENMHPICSICKTVFQGNAEGELSDSVSWKAVTTGINSSGNYLLRLEITGSGEIPDLDSYPWEAFRNQITGILLDDEITSIGGHAFEKMPYLDSIRHGNSFAKSDEGFPESLASIGTLAFFNCQSLTEVYIPKNMTSLGDGAFAGCSDLTTFIVDSGNTSFSSLEREDYSNLYDYRKSVLYFCGSDDYSYSENVSEIGAYAFYKKKLTYLFIGHFWKIGDKAFAGCSCLTEVKMSCDTGIDIADNAFEGDVINMIVSDFYYENWMNKSEKSYGGVLSWYKDDMYEWDIDLETHEIKFSLTGDGELPEYKPEVWALIPDNEEYTVSYFNNRKPGTGIVIVKPIGDKHGIIVSEFTISKGSIDISDIPDSITLKAGDMYKPKSLQNKYINYHFKVEEDSAFSVSEDGREITVQQCNATNGSTDANLYLYIDDNEYFYGGNCKKLKVKLEHNYKLFKSQRATYKASGFNRYKCESCGDSYDEVIKKLPGMDVGSSTMVAGISYKVLSNSTNTVQVAKIPKKKSVVIPATIKIYGKTYNVTSIGAKACYKNLTVKSITVGRNVKSVGKYAFYGCKKLTYLKFMRRSTTSFGTRSFNNINKSVMVRVPARCYKSYKVRLRKAGVNSSKQKIKKYSN